MPLLDETVAFAQGIGADPSQTLSIAPVGETPSAEQFL